MYLDNNIPDNVKHKSIVFDSILAYFFFCIFQKLRDNKLNYTRRCLNNMINFIIPLYRKTKSNKIYQF